MKRTKLAVTLTTSALLAAEAACADNAPSASAPGIAAKSATMQAATLAGLSRTETQKLLASLERAKEPEPRMGAMCYEMAAPPDRTEYICPTCGEKTLYTGGMAEEVAFNLEGCRSFFRTMPHHETMTLDESSFCRKCQPDSSAPQLVLTVRYADGLANVVHGVTRGDLQLLAAFFKGETSIDGPGEMTTVKTMLPRLRELLSLKESK